MQLTESHLSRETGDFSSTSSDEDLFQQMHNSRWKTVTKEQEKEHDRAMRPLAYAGLTFPGLLITTYVLKKTGHFPKWLHPFSNDRE